MSVLSLPPHLPRPYPDPEAYAGAYQLIRRVDEVFHGPDSWQEIRIRPGLSARQVYDRLPVAAGHEFAGYLTRTRIRYVPGWKDGADTLAAKACTFHSHPQDHPLADQPSDRDIYSFLRFRHLRHVTVGRTLIWVFDKTPATLDTVARLNAWEVRNMVRTLGEAGFDDYPSLALHGIAPQPPEPAKQARQPWPEQLEEALRITVTLLERNPGSR